MFTRYKTPIEFVLARKRRNHTDLPDLAAYLLIGGIVVCGFMGMCTTGADALLWPFCGLCIFGLALLPVAAGWRGGQLLDSFRRGRLLEDVQLTGIRGCHLSDGIAKHALKALFLPSVALYVALMAVSVGLDSVARGVALAWWPTVVAVTLLVSYLRQLWVVWSSERTMGAARAFLINLIWFGLVNSFIFGNVVHPEILVPCSILAAALVARALVLLKLDHEATLDAIGRRISRWWRPSKPNSWIRSCSKNPIVVRETSRSRLRVPLGLMGALAWNFGIGFLWPLMALSSQVGLEPRQVRFFLLAGVLVQVAMVAIGRSAFVCARGLIDERRERTQELLRLTTLTSREVVDGWIQWAVYPRLRELAVGATIIFLAAIIYDNVPGATYLAWGAMMAAIALFSIAYISLGAAAQTGSMFHCYWNTLAWMACVCLLFLPNVLPSDLFADYRESIVLVDAVVVPVVLIGWVRRVRRWAIADVERFFTAPEDDRNRVVG